MDVFTSLLVAGIPMLAIIFGLVEYIKSFGVTGNKLTVISSLIGVGLGIAYRIAEFGLPMAYPEWFTTVMFGIAMGLVASGFFNFLDKRFPPTE